MVIKKYLLCWKKSKKLLLTKYKKNIIIIRELFNNYTIMHFTTTTEIARKWSKVFDNLTYATVLNNNTDIWMLIWTDLYKLMMEKWILEDLLEDLEMSKNQEYLKQKYQDSVDSWISNLVI